MSRWLSRRTDVLFQVLRVAVAPYPVIELFAVRFLAAAEDRQRAPGFFHHIHNAV